MCDIPYPLIFVIVAVIAYAYALLYRQLNRLTDAQHRAADAHNENAAKLDTLLAGGRHG